MNPRLLNILLLKTLACYITQTLPNLQETIMFGYYVDVLSYVDIKIIETVPNMDIPMCVKSCKHSDMCDYINFKRNVGFCFHLGLMTSQNFSVVLTKMPGYVYGNKSQWNQVSMVFITVTTRPVQAPTSNFVCIRGGSILKCFQSHDLEHGGTSVNLSATATTTTATYC